MFEGVSLWIWGFLVEFWGSALLDLGAVPLDLGPRGLVTERDTRRELSDGCCCDSCADDSQGTAELLIPPGVAGIPGWGPLPGMALLSLSTDNSQNSAALKALTVLWESSGSSLDVHQIPWTFAGPWKNPGDGAR